MIPVAIVGILALIGAFGYLLWRVRRRRPNLSLISFVAWCVSFSVEFDPAVLARVASAAWNADLGDGGLQGPDGFVAGRRRDQHDHARGSNVPDQQRSGSLTRKTSKRPRRALLICGFAISSASIKHGFLAMHWG